jgi:uncharacterized RDD family membrane protein YckC
MSKTVYPAASLWRRLAAMVYDSLILMAVSMGYGALFLAVKYRFIAEPLAEGERASMGTPGFFGLILTIMLFYSFFWHRGGQTVGMRAWRLQLLRPDGEYPHWGQCFLRCLVAPFSLVLGGIGYFWCLFDAEGQTLHDKASKTLVVVLPKPEKKKGP